MGGAQERDHGRCQERDHGRCQSGARAESWAVPRVGVMGGAQGRSHAVPGRGAMGGAGVGIMGGAGSRGHGRWRVAGPWAAGAVRNARFLDLAPERNGND